MSIVTKAAQYAEQAHRGQVRKYTGRPYIGHPLRVAGRTCLIPGMSDDEVAAAWLHDTIEDCGLTYYDLEHRFGAIIASTVLELTNKSKGSKLPREERKRMDRDHLTYASRPAKIIKFLDRIDNLNEMQASDRRFAALYARESLALANALMINHANDAVLRALADELFACVDKISLTR